MSSGRCRRCLMLLEVEVQLHPPGVVITVNKFFDVDELQAGLSKAAHYTIRELVPQ